MSHPHLIIIAGPNGAGKSTAAPLLLRDTLGVVEFVNADAIAQGLSGFQPELAGLQAERIMLKRLQGLADARRDFAFETTLASRSFAPWIGKLKQDEYFFEIVFLYLASPDVAVSRVEERVRMGGHSVPENVIRRRYRAGIRNFYHLYRPLADFWRIYDNTSISTPSLRLIAKGKGDTEKEIRDPGVWDEISREANNA